MFALDIRQFVPRFLLGDKNGYALAKAIEAALQTLNAAAAQGLSCVTDVGSMPEWRLDEMAWELNCLYDYTGSIAQKRAWIANAMPYYSVHGTLRAIYNYLEGVFEHVDVQEWPDYDGDPFHFRVIVTGQWSAEANAWTQSAIAAAKNVRSVLDSITFNGGSCTAEAAVGTAVTGEAIYDAAYAN